MRHAYRSHVAALLFLVFPATAWASEDRVMAPAERAFSAFSVDPHRQFDFWIGEWDVILAMQQPDLTFKDTIRSRASIYSILDGKAILELWDSGPIKGYSLRYFDPAKQKWVLWLLWPGPNSAGKSTLEGVFRHGRGNFETTRTNPAGEELRGRYSFNDITPFSLRWDDLWSKDGGKTWSKNWRMEWTRLAVDPVWPIDRDTVPTFGDGSRCDDANFRPYEALVGSWRGDETALEAYRILGGCAVMAFLEGETSEFWIFTWVGAKSRWEVDVLDQRRDTAQESYSSGSDWTSMASEGGESISFAIEGDHLTYSRGGHSSSLTRKR